MTEETDQPVTETAETQAPAAPATTEPPQPTLDEVYSRYKVDDLASDFKPQRQEVQPPAAQLTPQTTPDPILDPQGYKSWMERNAQETHNLRQSLSQLEKTLGQLSQQSLKAREEADIKAAVHSVKKAGFDAEDDFIEIALGQKARQDPKFLALYNSRTQNPKAWNAALGAVANEFKGKYAFKTDPQLAENVRAAKASTQTTQSPSKQTTGNRLDEMFAETKSPAEFDQLWESVRAGNSY